MHNKDLNNDSVMSKYFVEFFWWKRSQITRKRELVDGVRFDARSYRGPYSLLKAEKTETFQEANDQDYQENETERRQADDGGNSLDSVQPPVGIGRHHFDHRKWSKQGALENICRIAF